MKELRDYLERVYREAAGSNLTPQDVAAMIAQAREMAASFRSQGADPTTTNENLRGLLAASCFQLELIAAVAEWQQTQIKLK